MKRLLVFLLLSACTPAPEPMPSAWRIESRLAVEDGAHLEPDDPAFDIEAAPSAMIREGDELWVVYANLQGYRPGGPGWLARHDASTLARQQLIRLSNEDHECRNPVALHRFEDELFIACAGAISFDEPSGDGLVARVTLEGELTGLAPVGHSPGSITHAAGRLWMGDGEQGGLWHVDAHTLGDARHLSPCVVDETHQGFVSELFSTEGRLFAACFNDDTLQEIDPLTGSARGAPLPTGDGPARIVRLGSSLFVLDNLGGTLTRVSLDSPPRAEPGLVSLGRAGVEGGNDPQGIAGDETLAGITNSAWGTFVVLELDTSEPRLVAALDLKATPQASSNFPTAVTYADGVFHVLVPGLEGTRNTAPGEILRIVRAE